MPYTFAHPGFSIWLKNRWFKKLSLNGLVFGSVSPDFDILFRFTNPRFHLFFLDSITIFCILLPLSILISFIFHYFVRNTLIEYLPNSFSTKLKVYSNFKYFKWFRKNYKIEIISIVTALVLHFILDNLFHWNAYHYMKIIHEGIYPNYYLVDFHYYFGWYFPMFLSTFLGFYFLYKFYEKSEYFNSNLIKEIIYLNNSKKLFWIILILTSLLFSFLKLYFLKYEGNGYAWHSLIIYFTSGLIFSFYVTPILYSMVKKVKNYRAID